MPAAPGMTPRWLPYTSLGRPPVSPGFAGCHGAGRSAPAHGSPALLVGGWVKRWVRRNHFPIATKPSGNDHQLRLAQTMRVQSEFVAVFYVEFFSQRRQTHLSERDAGTFSFLLGCPALQLFSDQTAV